MSQLSINELHSALSEFGVRVFSEDVVLSIVRQLCPTISLTEGKKNKIYSDARLKKGEVKFPRIKDTFSFLCYEGTIPEEVALYAYGRDSYISHASALRYHNLTTDLPPYHFANKEQPAKDPSPTPLSQEGLDNAFSSPPRKSNNASIWEYQGTACHIVLLSGKSTDLRGVMMGKYGQMSIQVTNIARTLVDCCVRPFYVSPDNNESFNHMVTAFRNACEVQSPSELVEEILDLLNAINHKYPYHQLIGFYFQRACPQLPPELWQPLKDLEIEFNFYSHYEMTDPNLDSAWKVYYPSVKEQ